MNFRGSVRSRGHEERRASYFSFSPHKLRVVESNNTPCGHTLQSSLLGDRGSRKRTANRRFVRVWAEHAISSPQRPRGTRTSSVTPTTQGGARRKPYLCMEYGKREAWLVATGKRRQPRRQQHALYGGHADVLDVRPKVALPKQTVGNTSENAKAAQSRRSWTGPPYSPAAGVRTFPI